VVHQRGFVVDVAVGDFVDVADERLERSQRTLRLRARTASSSVVLFQFELTLSCWANCAFGEVKEVATMAGVGETWDAGRDGPCATFGAVQAAVAATFAVVAVVEPVVEHVVESDAVEVAAAEDVLVGGAVLAAAADVVVAAAADVVVADVDVVASFACAEAAVACIVLVEEGSFLSGQTARTSSCAARWKDWGALCVGMRERFQE